MISFTKYINEKINEYEQNIWFPNEKKFLLIGPDELEKSNYGAEITVPHIFELDEYGKIKKSCCRRFDAPYSVPPNQRLILSVSQMRFLAASFGKEVCGACVSHLYSNKD